MSHPLFYYPQVCECAPAQRYYKHIKCIPWTTRRKYATPPVSGLGTQTPGGILSTACAATSACRTIALSGPSRRAHSLCKLPPKSCKSALCISRENCDRSSTLIFCQLRCELSQELGMVAEPSSPWGGSPCSPGPAPGRLTGCTASCPAAAPRGPPEPCQWLRAHLIQRSPGTCQMLWP